MLTLILLLAAEPQAAPAPAIQSPQALTPVISPVPDPCRARPLRTEGPLGMGRLGTSRSDDVGHYLLLERRIDGCPAPILVNRRVPGSNAIGRNLGAPR